MESNEIRKQLIILLDGSQAHISFNNAIKNFPIDKINERIKDVPYSLYEIVEHMRITQQDILDYISGAEYKELRFPDEYWPVKGKDATAENWNNSIRQLNEDLAALKKIVLDPQTDFTAPLSHNANHNIFRGILIMGNHNSYHTGQILILKRALDIY